MRTLPHYDTFISYISTFKLYKSVMERGEIRPYAATRQVRRPHIS